MGAAVSMIACSECDVPVWVAVVSPPEARPVQYALLDARLSARSRLEPGEGGVTLTDPDRLVLLPSPWRRIPPT